MSSPTKDVPSSTTEEPVAEVKPATLEEPTVEKATTEPAIESKEDPSREVASKDEPAIKKEPAKDETVSEDHASTDAPKEDSKEDVKETKEDANDEAKEDTEEDHKLEPKRRTAYNIYVSEVQAATKKEFPNLSANEIAKVIGANWKALTAEQKQPYEAQAKRYRETTKEVEKPAEKPAAETEGRYSLRSSSVIKGDEILGKKRAVESEELDESKRQRVTSEE